ncbi:hypothetical protein [Kitasatospora viridis]|uniref:Prephenate dehydratase n=1 Tax=Kitasatospora viridis TaxID=281105 RepID=A0A561UMS6_9ACTN|nr:hypothetical protein [Kitasatospora viridis]TWG00673.1 hypothetical protein FHX73_114553 [Kitasatospora viridis]
MRPLNTTSPRLNPPPGSAIHRHVRRSRLVVATLGPTGTDAHAEASRRFRAVRLTDSFEQAMQAAVRDGTPAVVAAGFVERDHPTGEVSDLWVNLHFRYTGKAELVEVWQAPTKPICLATAPTVRHPRTIALHPATATFADRTAPDAERRWTNAKPLAVREVIEGRADGCVASTDLARRAGLTVLEEFRPTMVWCLYQAVNADGPVSSGISG